MGPHGFDGVRDIIFTEYYLSMSKKDFDPTDMAAREREDAERKLKARLEVESEEADIKWLMGSRRGRRIIWRILERAGVFRLSFNTNAMQMAFAEGNKNEGIRTLAMIHSQCPELYPTMVKEQTNEQRTTS